MRSEACRCCGRSKDHPKVRRLTGRHAQGIQAHHLDYHRPLDVVWVCIACHLHLEICAWCGWPENVHRAREGGYRPLKGLPHLGSGGAAPDGTSYCAGYRPRLRYGECLELRVWRAGLDGSVPAEPLDWSRMAALWRPAGRHGAPPA